MNAGTFTRAYTNTRERVLRQNARQYRQAALNLRERAPRFPDQAKRMHAEADQYDAYATACDVAADDPTAPTPTLPAEVNA